MGKAKPVEFRTLSLPLPLISPHPWQEKKIIPESGLMSPLTSCGCLCREGTAPGDLSGLLRGARGFLHSQTPAWGCWAAPGEPCGCSDAFVADRNRFRPCPGAPGGAQGSGNDVGQQSKPVGQDWS